MVAYVYFDTHVGQHPYPPAQVCIGCQNFNHVYVFYCWVAYVYHAYVNHVYVFYCLVAYVYPETLPTCARTPAAAVATRAVSAWEGGGGGAPGRGGGIERERGGGGGGGGK